MNSKFFNAFSKIRYLALLMFLILVSAHAWGETAKLIWSSGNNSGANYYFQNTSGSITDIVSFSTAKNSAQSNPAYNSNNSQLRLYYATNGSGGSITLTPATGVTITGISIASATTPTTKYKVGTGTATAVSYNNADPKVATVSNISATSSATLTIQNCNTSNTQLQIKYIEITYSVESSCSDPATALSITSASVATVGTPLTLTTTGGNGETVTWSVTNGTGSATVAGSTLTPTGAGTVTVKATQPDGATYCGKEVTKTLTISKAAATITLSEAGATTNVAGTHYGGDSYTLPSSTSATCGTKVLVGWSTVEVAETDTKPSSNFYEKGASATLTAGSNTFYAVFATASAGGDPEWVETSLASLGASDIFVIVGNNGSTYAMTNGNGTGSAPGASAVTISDSKISGTVNDNIKWNISGNASDGYVFYPNGSTTTWLYCTNANNGLRVGTNDNKTFTISTEGYLYHTGTSRYVGIYNSQDWRCYTSINSNIEKQTFSFYKYSAGTTYSDYSTTCTPPCTALGTINGSVNLPLFFYAV